ncbi:ras-related and estrogen-regulated growth inhibitor-like [Ptychodera flava]|uniref:ras-related and estrogen-regulated growth inhibitor-like n=1 Tax=Ptychodera flava TaxID=63121 RepID=UPI00396A2D1A
MTNLKMDKASNHCRIVLLGQSGVGKTAIAVRYLCGRYLHEYASKLELCYEKSDTIDGKKVQLEILDTADQDKTEKYLESADGVLYIYSTTNRKSFQAAQEFHETLDRCNKNVPVVVLANKCDFAQGRQVSHSEGLAVANQRGWSFYETSAATEITRIKLIFEDMIRSCISHKESNRKMKTSRKPWKIISRSVSFRGQRENTKKDYYRKIVTRSSSFRTLPKTECTA